MLKTLAALLVIGSVCGGLLVYTAQTTSQQIADNRARAAQALMQSLLQQPLTEVAEWQDDLFTTCNGWVFVRGSQPGYAADIHYLGLVWDNTLTSTSEPAVSLRVTGHQETPGIGDFIEHEKDDYLPTKDNSTRQQWQALDAISGATVTHAAIQRAVTTVSERVTQFNQQGGCDDSA